MKKQEAFRLFPLIGLVYNKIILYNDQSEGRDYGVEKSMVEQIAEVGEILKKKREESNLSFKEIETATSIRMGYLQAIERGELNKLISPVYAQGFIKQYSNFLGLDGDQLVKDYPELFQTTPSQHFDFGIGTLEVRDNPGAGVKWLPNAVWIAAFFLLLIVAWYFARLLEVI